MREEEAQGCRLEGEEPKAEEPEAEEGDEAPITAEDGGCTCSLTARPTQWGGAWFLLALVAALGRRRRTSRG